MHKPLAYWSTHHDPSGEMLHAKPTYFGQAPMSSHVEREEKAPSVLVPRSNSDDAIKAAMSSTFEFKRAHRYTCHICNAIFTTRQTYHGHMSLHNNI